MISIKNYLAILVAGGTLPLAFAPFGYTFLAVICLSVLFFHWRHCSPAEGFKMGWLFGMGQFGVGVSWVYISVHDFGGTPWFPALFVTCFFVTMMALFPAIAGYLIGRWHRHFSNGCRNGAVLLLTMPVLWALLEWIRGWFLTGFPWLLIGYSQIDTWLAGYAPIGGIYIVSWLTAWAAALLTLIYCLWTSKNRPFLLIFMALSAMALLWGTGKMLQGVAWTASQADPVKVALVQGNISQELKWLPSMKWPSIERYFEMTEKKARDADLVIWPETAMPVLYSEVSELLTWFRSKVLTNRPALLTGAPLIDRRDGRLYNSMVLLSENNEQFYYKHHLVPFGEYLPVRSLLSWAAHLFPLPGDDFTSGKPNQPVLKLGSIALALSICYEDAFGNEMLASASAANILVNVSNDAWFGHSMAAAQHLQMARFRALEFGRPMLRATNTGISALIDKNGHVYAQAPQFQEAVLKGEVYPAEGQTPYMYWGNTGIITVLFLLLLYAVWSSARRRNTVA